MKKILKAFFLGVVYSFTLLSADSEIHNIAMSINIDCPLSDELQAFIESIPSYKETDTSEYEEWKRNFVNNLTKLIDLAESGRVYNCFWTVNVDEKK